MSTEKQTVIIDADLEDLIPGFLENRNIDIEKLNEAISGEDTEKLRSIGHNLKGVGGGFGFDKISEIGAEIEASAKLSDLNTIRNLVDDLVTYLNSIEIEYQEMP